VLRHECSAWNRSTPYSIPCSGGAGASLPPRLHLCDPVELLSRPIAAPLSGRRPMPSFSTLERAARREACSYVYT
jgi:hypothetical protein